MPKQFFHHRNHRLPYKLFLRIVSSGVNRVRRRQLTSARWRSKVLDLPCRSLTYSFKILMVQKWITAKDKSQRTVSPVLLLLRNELGGKFENQKSWKVLNLICGNTVCVLQSSKIPPLLTFFVTKFVCFDVCVWMLINRMKAGLVFFF